MTLLKIIGAVFAAVVIIFAGILVTLLVFLALGEEEAEDQE